jgi:hypothetical protein
MRSETGDNRGRELHWPLLTGDVGTISVSHQPVLFGVQPTIEFVANDRRDHSGREIRRQEVLVITDKSERTCTPPLKAAIVSVRANASISIFIPRGGRLLVMVKVCPHFEAV